MAASIGSAGVTFSDGTVLSGRFPENGRSLGADGYQIFPSGIIHQWGTWNGVLATSGNGGNTGYFAAPMKFPNTTLQLVAVAGYTEFSIVPPTINYTSDDNVVIATSWTSNATQTLFIISLDGLGSSVNVRKIRWYAIGY